MICKVPPQPTERASKATCGGDAGGAPCLFPFTYNGKEYTECTTIDSGDRGLPWCFTDPRNKWGTCTCTPSPSIPKPTGDDKIVAYWDYGNCGPQGNDYNWDWCSQASFKCDQEVSTNLCGSGKAELVKALGDKTKVSGYNTLRDPPAPWNINIDGCDFAYYAQYKCIDTAQPTEGGSKVTC